MFIKFSNSTIFLHKTKNKLQVGDQLLEVCGVNLRGCGKDQAVLVLQQVGNSISMKVQFNPLEFHSMQSLVSANTGTSKLKSSFLLWLIILLQFFAIII